jgi:hypothetical protein
MLNRSKHGVGFFNGLLARTIHKPRATVQEPRVDWFPTVGSGRAGRIARGDAVRLRTGGSTRRFLGGFSELRTQLGTVTRDEHFQVAQECVEGAGVAQPGGPIAAR